MEVVNEARDARLSALGFDVARQRVARSYRWRRVAVAGLRVLVYLALSVWLLGGFTFTVKGWTSVLGAGVPQYALYAVLVYFLFWIPVIPLGIVGGFFLERKYGVSVQGLRSWIADAAKSLAIGLGFSVLAVVVVYVLLAADPDRWWVFAWLIGLAVGAILAWAGPVVIAPLFYKFEPLADEGLAARLRTLAARAGTKVVGVFRMGAAAKTTRAFGGLAGIGSTRRIILSDTLLTRYTPEEVETVIAHELGHHVHRDTLRLAAASASASFVALFVVDRALRAGVPALGLAGMADVAGLPLVGITLAAMSVIFGPLVNALSREREAKADEFAVRMTGNQAAFATTMVKIHDQNLGVADPHPLVELLFHDHPSGRRRVESLRGRS